MEPNVMMTPKTTSTLQEQRILESFLHEIDVADILPATPNGRDSTTKRRAKPSLPPTKKRSTTSKRRKEESTRLRAETQALETHLMSMRLQRGHSFAMNTSSGLVDNRLGWKTTAETERRRLQLAQGENVRLKVKLQSCMQTCTSLQTALSMGDIKQWKAEIADAIAGRTLQTEMRTSHQLQSTSSIEFGMLEGDVGARMNKLASVLHEVYIRVPNTDTDQFQVSREQEGSATATLELNQARLVPFRAETTINTVWRVMKLGVVPDERSLRVIKHTKDMIASEASITQALEGGGNVEIRTRCIMKRVELSGGYVILVEARTEWFARPDHASEWSHVTRDSGMGVVFPVDVPLNSSTPGVCQLRTSLRLQTNEFGTKPARDSPSLLSRAVSDVVVPCFSNILSARHQLVDNILLDSSRKAVRVAS